MSTARLTGRVTRLVRERGFGFIAGANGQEYFFHRSECPTFDELQDGLRGNTVTFDEQAHAKGARAANVQPVSGR